MSESAISIFLQKREENIPPIHLVATELLTAEQVKKKLEEIFTAGVDKDIYRQLHKDVRNSPSLYIYKHPIDQNTIEGKLIEDAKDLGIYQELDLGHIIQLGKMHLGGKKVFDTELATIAYTTGEKPSKKFKFKISCDKKGHLRLALDEIYPETNIYAGRSIIVIFKELE